MILIEIRGSKPNRIRIRSRLDFTNHLRQYRIIEDTNLSIFICVFYYKYLNSSLNTKARDKSFCKVLLPISRIRIDNLGKIVLFLFLTLIYI